MLRFLFILIVLSTSIIWGVRKCDILYDSILCQEGMVRFLQYLKRSIQSFRIPVDEIMEGADDFFDREIIDDMKRLGIDVGFSRHSNCFRYDVFTQRSLSEFLRRLGSLSGAEQLIACDNVLMVLSEELLKRREAYPAERKLWLTLGFTVGIGVSILLL